MLLLQQKKKQRATIDTDSLPGIYLGLPPVIIEYCTLFRLIILYVHYEVLKNT